MQQNALDETGKDKCSLLAWDTGKTFSGYLFLLQNIWLQYNTSILILVSSCDIQLLKVDEWTKSWKRSYQRIVAQKAAKKDKNFHPCQMI